MCGGCGADPSPKMDRRNFLKLGSAGLAGAVLLGTTGGKVLAQSNSSLAEEFRSAADEYGVPVELLLAMGYTNTFWEMPQPNATAFEPGDLHGHGTYGVMQLYQNPSRDTVGRAASLTRFSEWELKSDRAANVRGGAAVLADMAGTPKPDSLNGWQEAIAEYGGVDFYAIEVFQTLQDGASATISTGETLQLDPQEVEIPAVISTARAANTDYPKAEWYPAARGNYGNSDRERKGSPNINMLVVHTVEGPVSAGISTFQNPNSGVSAHYIVGDLGRVVQCVRHEDVGYHAGHLPTNKHSIGIEHGGESAERATWTREKMRASARLAAYCSKRHNIPLDRRHIIGHHEVPGCPNPGGGGYRCHTDPGPHFRWGEYMDLIKRYRRQM
jgi:hypothetical protein